MRQRKLMLTVCLVLMSILFPIDANAYDGNADIRAGVTYLDPPARTGTCYVDLEVNHPSSYTYDYSADGELVWMIPYRLYVNSCSKASRRIIDVSPFVKLPGQFIRAPGAKTIVVDGTGSQVFEGRFEEKELSPFTANVIFSVSSADPAQIWTDTSLLPTPCVGSLPAQQGYGSCAARNLIVP